MPTGVLLAVGLVSIGAAVWGLRRAMRVFERHGRDIWGGRFFYRLDGFNRLFCRHYHRLRHAPVQLPQSGGAVLVANHISGLDPLLLGAATERRLHFLVAREQYERFGTRWFFRGTHCIPVDRSSRPERAFRAALEVLARGEVIAVFPQGGIVADGEQPPLKSGALRMAQLAGVALVPVYIDGVAGRGKVLGALLPRSHATLTGYAPVKCSGQARGDCLRVLAALLRGRPEQARCADYDPFAGSVAAD